MEDTQTVLELHLGATQSDIKAVELLAQHCELSRTVLKKAMKNGALWLERDDHVQRLRRADRKLLQGDKLHLYYDAKIQKRQPQPAELIADEGDYSVWCKPSGMLSQGSKWGDHCSINRWVEQRLQPQRNAFIVHRLDRAASGLILLAHSKQLARQLSALFQQRQVEKHYRVWVEGKFPGQQCRFDQPLDDRPAVSYAKALNYDGQKDQSLLQVKIDTGRKHQIRRHLAAAGFPVVGDRLYGAKETEQDLQLQAVYLAFALEPDGERKEYCLSCVNN